MKSYIIEPADIENQPHIKDCIADLLWSLMPKDRIEDGADIPTPGEALNTLEAAVIDACDEQ